MIRCTGFCVACGAYLRYRLSHTDTWCNVPRWARVWLWVGVTLEVKDTEDNRKQVKAVAAKEGHSFP